HFYDAKGEWVKFLSKSPDYQGTDILESGEGDGVFLVIDEWLTEESFKEFIASRKAEYDLLEEKAKSVSRSKKRVWISI
ncbi:MAG TPA: hypothetical protein DEH15_06400, partial [Marinilabiliales bacterium]|nr:hypothetical protein [Marinilabiliales bacterium]